MVHRRKLTFECAKWMQWPRKAPEELSLLQHFAFSYSGIKPLLDAFILMRHGVSAIKRDCLSGTRSHRGVKSAQHYESSQHYSDLQQQGHLPLCNGKGNVELGFLKHNSIIRKQPSLRSPRMKLLLQSLRTVKLNCTKHMLLA